MDTRTFSEGSLKNRKGENFGDKTFELPFCDLKKTSVKKKKSMGENPSQFSATGGSRNRVTGIDTSRFPVEHVRWTEAVEFCDKLSRLPAE